MKPSVSDLAVEVVAGLTVSDVRTAFSSVRLARERCPGSFWTLYMPNIGLTVGEFCVGYLLRVTGSGR